MLDLTERGQLHLKNAAKGKGFGGLVRHLRSSVVLEPSDFDKPFLPIKKQQLKKLICLRL